MRFRPPAFASYRQASATWTTASIEAPGPRAQPPLTVTEMLWRPAETGSAAVTERIRSAMARPPSRSVRGRMTRNSSPPHRPTMSPARSSLRSRSVKVLSTSSPAVGTEGPGDQGPSLALRRRSDVIRVDPLQPGDLVDEQPERLARRVDHDDVPVLRAQGRDYGQRRLPRNQGIGTSAWRLGLVPWWAPRTGEHFGDQVCDLCECVRPEAAGG